jgi:hypothetical protein
MLHALATYPSETAPPYALDKVEGAPGMDAVEERKNPARARNQNPVVQLAANHYTG